MDFLCDPVDFMLTQQLDWDKGQDTPMWRLRGPVTAILRPGPTHRQDKNTRTYLAVENFLMTAPIDDTGLTFLDFNPDAGAGGNAGPPPDVVEKATENGGFYAEFAFCTSIVTIFYWPPKGAGELYNGELTKSVLGFMPGNGSRTGTLHFDLKARTVEGMAKVVDPADPLGIKPAARNRAEFIVECLQMSHKLKDRLAAIEVEQGDSSLTTPQQGVQVRAAPMTALQVAAQPPIGFARRSQEDLPHVFVERLSATDDACVTCCNVHVYEDPAVPGQFIMDDIICKCYYPCGTTPPVINPQATPQV
ncbi:hypothetical protein OP10G_2500 [Fimbriimonas ginsengisoli Gsoil 348]|uniref:Uncharacterized protein n=1 Tax=Fimbriimonas ginsengisoli Gsoil 348 TaxID=661478 RepID=A0A068NQN2_FIMGI|nr:hypothetical protein OP10G_2500 [Fimbriimonas ginsengisoli Gsoil 348]